MGNSVQSKQKAGELGLPKQEPPATGNWVFALALAGMKIHLITLTLLALLIFHFTNVSGQEKTPYTASFIGRMGVDTVLIETYTMLNNHLYGKAFIRVPEDYIAAFSIHFYPDGSIRKFTWQAMDPFNSSVPFQAKSNAMAYIMDMNCSNDTCTFYNSERDKPAE